MKLYDLLQVTDGSETIYVYDRDLKKLYNGTATNIDSNLLSYEVLAVYTQKGNIVIEVR